MVTTAALAMLLMVGMAVTNVMVTLVVVMVGGSPHKGKHWLKPEGISCRWFTNTKYSFHILIP